jgi:NADH-quinone oxidoreductase subunit A
VASELKNRLNFGCPTPELMTEPSITEYLPVFLMLLLAAGFVGMTMVVTHLLGPKRKTKVKLEAFECGIPSTGNARSAFHIKYFLVAILFVLFDVEVIFMYPWAVNFKTMGIPGFLEMILFIGLLLVGFFYILKKKALEWED